jgi:hypothetical protein
VREYLANRKQLWYSNATKQARRAGVVSQLSQRVAEWCEAACFD